VRDAEVRADLAAARQMRQRGADRRNRRRDPFGDDRRANHGRHDEDMVADADLSAGRG
jgi:hypothetical protein